MENRVDKIDWVEARYVELSLLDEKRLKAAYHQQGTKKELPRPSIRGLNQEAYELKT